MESRRFLQRVPEYARRNLVSLLALLIGVVISALAFLLMQRSEQQLARLEFEQDADTRYFALKRELQGTEMVVYALQAFCRHAKFSQEEFRSFSELLLSHNKSTYALYVAPRVKDRERDRFELHIRQSSFPAFRITESAADGQMAAADRRPEYFPITFLFPLAGREKAHGFDTASEPVRKEAIDFARDSGELTATKMLQLVQPDDSHQSFTFFAPYYRPGGATATVDQRRQNIAGYAAGVFHLDAILTASLADIKSADMDIHIYDGQQQGEKKLLYFHPAIIGTPPLVSSQAAPALLQAGGMSYSKTLPVANQQWLIVFRATPQFIARYSSWHPLGSLGAGLLISIMVAGYIAIINRRNEYVESLVAIRTSELEEERASLEVRVDKRTEELALIQETLKGSLAAWQTTFDSMSDAVSLLDHEGRILQCNRSMCSLLGTEEDALRGSLCTITDDRCWQHHECPFMAVKMTLKRHRAEVLWRGRWLDIHVDPVLEPDGKTFHGAVHIMTDITERKQAEEALVKLSHVIAQSPISIVITDQEGKIEFVNPEICRITGFAEAELLGRSPSIFKSGETSDEVYRELWQTISSGRTWHGELRNRKKNGDHFWESEIISPILNQQGAITNYVAIKEDITARKSLEMQLRHSQKMEAVGQLAGGVAHDFNNILSVIMGYCDILEMEGKLDTGQQEKLNEIIAAAERAAKLTGGLLAFSRKQEIDLSAVNLNDIVHRLQKFLARVIGEDIHLKQVSHEVGLPVMVDSGQIEQVIINLATNARDAMPQGGTLTIETKLEELDANFARTHGYGYGSTGSYAVITISDTGCGMSEELQKKIFEPFFTTKELGKGTGLGMAIVYGIVKQHKGFINVYSEPDIGTAFRIYLPLLRPEDPPLVEQAAESAPLGGNETILVAEDDKSISNLMASLLKDYGYHVLLAEDGREAVACFTANRDKVDLILMDMIMPKQSGQAAAEEIWQMKPDMKILFASGYTGDFIRNRGIEEAGLDLITKPVKPMELLHKLRKILDS